MKVIDTVKKSFFTYPTLYLSKNFDSIKFSVMEHMFIVLGNGIEWAKTKNLNQGGYLLEPHYHNRKRVYDTPYGKDIIDIDITQYLQADKIYEFGEIDHKETKSSISAMSKIFVEMDEETKIILLNKFVKRKSSYEAEKRGKILWLESEFDKLPEKTLIPDQHYNETYKYFLRIIEPREEEDSSLGKRNPYPNFQKQYSCFWEKGVEYIQEDWRIEAINHLSYWKEYFNDSERIKEYSNYPKEKDDKEFLAILKRQIKDGASPKSVFDNYGYKPFDLNDKDAYKKASKERWDTDLSDIKSFIDETIYKLLK